MSIICLRALVSLRINNRTTARAYTIIYSSSPTPIHNIIYARTIGAFTWLVRSASIYCPLFQYAKNLPDFQTGIIFVKYLSIFHRFPKAKPYSLWNRCKGKEEKWNSKSFKQKNLRSYPKGGDWSTKGQGLEDETENGNVDTGSQRFSYFIFCLYFRPYKTKPDSLTNHRLPGINVANILFYLI